MKQRYVLILALLLVSFFAPLLKIPSAPAQNLPGDSLQQKTPKALSDKETRNLLNGEDIGLAKVAEMNGYPNPIRIISYASELNLNEDQALSVLKIHKKLRENARKIGADIINHEYELEKAFTDKSIIPEELIRLTTEIGVLQGRLRAAYLYASMQIKSLLTTQQMARYNEIQSLAAPDFNKGQVTIGEEP